MTYEYPAEVVIERARQAREMAAENERLRERVATLEEGMRKIKDEEGRVCEHFMECEHESCRSSCASWFIAESALLDGPHDQELNRQQEKQFLFGERYNSVGQWKDRTSNE